MSKSNIEFLHHAIDEIEFLENKSSSMTEEQFMHDETMMRAFARSLEIIGEAIKQVPETIRSKYFEIDWKSFAGLRDKLIHHYFGVDYVVVWDVVKNELHDLKTHLQHIIDSERSK